MRVRVEEREESPEAVCPLCRASLAGALWTCAACDTALHAECARELPRCPTLGCAGRPPEGARAPDRGPILPRRPFAAPGDTVVMADRAAHRGGLGGGVLGLLKLIAVVALVVLVLIPWRAPRVPPASPVVVDTPLQGHQVRLEHVPGRGLQARVDGHTEHAPFEVLHGCDYQGRTTLPGSSVELLHFSLRAETLTSDVYLGVRNDGRLVTVRVVASHGDGSMTLSPQHLDPATAPLASTPAEWIELLGSTDPVTVLDALSWISQRLEFGPVRMPDAIQESVRTAQTSPSVRQAVRELRDSPMPWVAEAARAYLAR